ncbi:hypothetical protein ABZ345_14465 [Lentzea sp. NPDC005914]|uniref:hypothetical protein n=1 Tax=Lentzea sp. NPDC005914 TaxID=3154572 RepID=UPI0033F1DBE6
MGAFNILVMPELEWWCPRCGLGKTRFVQFKYGAQIQKEYYVGDTLEWGTLDRGEPGLRHVAVLGFGLSCVDCGYQDDQDYRIDIRSDVISSVVPDDGELDYLSQGNHYWLVLER